MCMQKEVGNSGTRHIQGYIQFSDKIRLTGLRKLHGRAHWELARGTPEQNKAYCSKEGGTDFFERGSIREKGKSGELCDAIIDLRKGKSLTDVAIVHSGAFVKYSRGLREYFSIISSKPRDFKTEIFWFYGPTGVGKSRRVFDLVGTSAYYKMPSSKWWDGYSSQSDVVIDDYRRDMCTFSELLRLFDRYPHRIEAKGCSMEFNSRRIFVTSPKDPRETWRKESGEEREDIEQLLRRIEHVEDMGAVPYLGPPAGDRVEETEHAVIDLADSRAEEVLSFCSGYTDTRSVRSSETGSESSRLPRNG